MKFYLGDLAISLRCWAHWPEHRGRGARWYSVAQARALL